MSATKDLEGGVLLDTQEVTTIELLPNEAALVLAPDAAKLALPDGDDDEAFVPSHVMFLIGVYFMSEDDAFVEKTIRFALDKLEKAKAAIAAKEAEDQEQPRITQLEE